MLPHLLLALAALSNGRQEQSVEAEVLGNIRAQKIGPATIADFAQPEAFHRRFADRVILAWYSERFRVVIADEPDPNAAKEPDAASGPDAATPTSAPAHDASSPSGANPAGASEGATASWPLRIGAALVACAAIAWLLVRKRRTA